MVQLARAPKVDEPLDLFVVGFHDLGPLAFDEVDAEVRAWCVQTAPKAEHTWVGPSGEVDYGLDCESWFSGNAVRAWSGATH